MSTEQPAERMSAEQLHDLFRQFKLYCHVSDFERGSTLIEQFIAYRHAWNRAMAEIGYAGSEFYDDPKACAERIRKTQTGLMDAVKSAKRAEAKAKAERDAAIAERDALRVANVEIYALATRALADPSGTAELVEICEVIDGLRETYSEAQSNGTK